MDPTHVPDSLWKKMVTENRAINLDFLATKILLTRLRREILINPEPDNVEKCAGELKSLFLKCWNLPKVRNDLQKLIDQGDIQ